MRTALSTRVRALSSRRCAWGHPRVAQRTSRERVSATPPHSRDRERLQTATSHSTAFHGTNGPNAPTAPNIPWLLMPLCSKCFYAANAPEPLMFLCSLCLYAPNAPILTNAPHDPNA